MVRKIETFPPVTMAHIRGHGCRDLLHASAVTLSADGLHPLRPHRRRRAAGLEPARQ
jgi:hypothetical protein